MPINTKSLGTRAAETAAQILARLLNAPAESSTRTKQRTDRSKAQQAQKRYKFPPKSKKSKVMVHIPVWTAALDVKEARPTDAQLRFRADVVAKLPAEISAEMVLQELERGGYGGIALRGAGRTVESLAMASGLPRDLTELRLRHLRQRGLAAYVHTEYQPGVKSWVPVRDLDESPYTFNLGTDDDRVMPDRLDFIGALIEERRRENHKLVVARRNGLVLRRGRQRKVAA